MSPENFRKISLPELEISLYLYNFSKKESQITDWQTYKKIRTIGNKCTNIPGMSPRNFRKISYPELEISQYLCNFNKKVSQLTDSQTYRKFKIIWINCKFFPGKPLKIFKLILHPVQDIYLYWPNFSKNVSQLTYWQTYTKFKMICE